LIYLERTKNILPLTSWRRVSLLNFVKILAEKMKNKLLFALSLVSVVVFCVFSYLYLDTEVATFFYKNRPFFGFFEVVTQLGTQKWYLLSSAIFFVLFRYIFRLKEAANRFLYFFVAVAGSGLIIDILKFIFGRARPKLFFEQDIYGIKFFGTEHLYFSLPSGHSGVAFSVAVGVASFFPRYAILAFFAAAIVALSRVGLSVHYLSDIVAGSYIGVVIAVWVREKMIQKGVRF